MLRNLYVYPPSEKPIDICSRSEPASRLSDDVAHLQIVNAVIKIAPQLKSLMKGWWWNLFFFLPELQGAVSWHETFLCSQCCSKCEGWDTHDRSLCNWWAYKDSPTCLVMINKDRAKISYARGGGEDSPTCPRTHARSHEVKKPGLETARTSGQIVLYCNDQNGIKITASQLHTLRKKGMKEERKTGWRWARSPKTTTAPPVYSFISNCRQIFSMVKDFGPAKTPAHWKVHAIYEMRRFALTKKEKEKIRLIFHLIFSLLPTSEWVAFFMKWEAGYFLDRLSSGPHISRSHSALK